jgi:hypothetical protein
MGSGPSSCVESHPIHVLRLDSLDLLYVQLLPLSFIDCSEITISSEMFGK